MAFIVLFILFCMLGGYHGLVWFGVAHRKIPFWKKIFPFVFGLLSWPVFVLLYIYDWIRNDP